MILPAEPFAILDICHYQDFYWYRKLLPAEMFAFLDNCHWQDLYYSKRLLPFWTFAILQIFIPLRNFCHFGHLPLFKFSFIQDDFACRTFCHFGHLPLSRSYLLLGDFCHLQHLPLFSSILIQKAFAISDICHYSDFYWYRKLLPAVMFAILDICHYQDLYYSRKLLPAETFAILDICQYLDFACRNVCLDCIANNWGIIRTTKNKVSWKNRFCGSVFLCYRSSCMNHDKAPAKFLVLPVPATTTACWHSMPWNISAGAENKTLVFLDLFTFPLKNGSFILLRKLLFWSCLHALEKPQKFIVHKAKNACPAHCNIKKTEPWNLFFATPCSFFSLEGLQICGESAFLIMRKLFKN